jgi:hypothetical protein
VLKLADKHAVLCAECMFQRANERGVVLTLADLQQCGFNVRSPAKGSRGLLGGPGSWYDVFLSRESEPQPSLSEWLGTE